MWRVTLRGLVAKAFTPRRVAGLEDRIRSLATELIDGMAASGEPVWEVVETWLRSRPGGRVAPRRINTPRIAGMTGNPGIG